MKILLIYNPVSGKGLAANIVTEISGYLNEKNIDYIIYESQSKNDLQEYIFKNIANFTAVWGLGGDGTIRDIIESLSKCEFKLPLGIFPAGSGNDFIKSLNLDDKTVKELTDRYLNNNVEYIYSGIINEDIFINSVGTGIVCDILEKRLKFKKYISGWLCYLVSTLYSFIFYKPKKYKIYLDDKLVEDRYYIVVISNGKYFGAGMKVAPNAEIRSNDLNVLTLDYVNKFNLLKIFSKIYKGTHIESPYVKEYNCKKVLIEFEEKKEFINNDGDLIIENKLIASKSLEKKLKILI